MNLIFWFFWFFRSVTDDVISWKFGRRTFRSSLRQPHHQVISYHPFHIYTFFKLGQNFFSMEKYGVKVEKKKSFFGSSSDKNKIKTIGYRYEQKVFISWNLGWRIVMIVFNISYHQNSITSVETRFIFSTFFLPAP